MKKTKKKRKLDPVEWFLISLLIFFSGQALAAILRLVALLSGESG